MYEENAYCRKCGRPIRFLRTKKGKLMPVDGFSFNVVPKEGGTAYFNEAGERIVGAAVDKPGPNTVKAWMCHFVTCPEGEAFKNRKREESWNEMQARKIRERIEKEKTEADEKAARQEAKKRREEHQREWDAAQTSLFGQGGV